MHRLDGRLMLILSFRSSFFDRRGDGLGDGKHEEGTSKMLDGFTGLVVPPGSFSMEGFAGQCFSQIKYLSEFTSRFFTEDKQLTLFFSSSFLGILNALFFLHN